MSPLIPLAALALVFGRKSAPTIVVEAQLQPDAAARSGVLPGADGLPWIPVQMVNTFAQATAVLVKLEASKLYQFVVSTRVRRVKKAEEILALWATAPTLADTPMVLAYSRSRKVLVGVAAAARQDGKFTNLKLRKTWVPSDVVALIDSRGTKQAAAPAPAQ